MDNVKTETSAARLPQAWDRLAGDNPYLKRDFLAFVEGTEEDFHPTYHLFYTEQGEPDSLFVSFPKKGYNLGMFSPVDLPIPVTLIYLPMCVTRSGIVLGRRREEVLAYIRAMPGFKMVLNLPDGAAEGFAVGLTCPKCILRLRWDSFDDYLGSMRSSYRSHYQRILKKTTGLTIRYLEDGRKFDQGLYRLYRNVVERSRIRIETLSQAYFQDGRFRLFVAETAEGPAGFVQLLENGSELVFEFVGLDYGQNQTIPVYHRMLLEIVDYGIRNGFQTIDFGQTADDTKLKLGCQYTYLYAALHHANPLVNACCKRLAHALEYRPLQTQFHVFKEGV